MTLVEICTKIMTLGFTRNQAGTLASYVYHALKYKDLTPIILGCRMFKDSRTNQWGDESGLIPELQQLFDIK